ncbi:MAG: methylase domain protein [Geminicoccaceae bacterium]|nr:methylase domain protein [Geminicoccaceae bacterium]
MNTRCGSGDLERRQPHPATQRSTCYTSGSTLIACEKAGRQARLIELDPKYCDVIVVRWQAFGGGTATLNDDGRSYEEIAAGREAAAA